jgi:nucleotide-binding universal stress UspA family protein
MRQFKRILCPVDFSSHSKAALDEGASLAKAMGSELCLLHAYQNPAYVLPMSGYVGPTADMISRIRTQLADELEDMAKDYREQAIAVVTEVLEGVPYKCIVDHAREWKADLIVMGTHGRTALAHALAGSVAERVVRLAHCPVLVTRAGGEAPA